MFGYTREKFVTKNKLNKLINLNWSSLMIINNLIIIINSQLRFLPEHL